MNIFKFLISIILLIGILSCNKISERVEQKVNEKIDQTIDENLKKIDSSLNKSNLDSLKEKIQSLDSNVKKEMKKTDKKWSILFYGNAVSEESLVKLGVPEDIAKKFSE